MAKKIVLSSVWNTPQFIAFEAELEKSLTKVQINELWNNGEIESLFFEANKEHIKLAKNFEAYKEPIMKEKVRIPAFLMSFLSQYSK